jgi:hypothetical protein
MTETTPNSPRDTSGRFVKRAVEKAHTLNVPSDAGVHPMAKILFGWTEGRRTGALLFWLIGLAGLGLIGADLVVPHTEDFAIARMTGFNGVFGFCAFALIVLAGWPLGMLLRRAPDFYDPPEALPAHTDPALAATRTDPEGPV